MSEIEMDCRARLRKMRDAIKLARVAEDLGGMGYGVMADAAHKAATEARAEALAPVEQFRHVRAV